MRLVPRCCVAALILLHFLLASSAIASADRSSGASERRAWRISDILEAPRVDEISMSSDGAFALYVIRHGDLGANAKRSTLRLVDIRRGRVRTLFSSGWISNLQIIPGSRDWSLLADTGSGVQLYRLNPRGRLSSIVFNHDTDRVGGASEESRPFGVSDYGWLPDGAGFWYLRRTRPSVGAPIVNPQYAPLSTTFGTGSIQLRLRRRSGRDVLVDQVEATRGQFARPSWDMKSSSLTYMVQGFRDRRFRFRRWSEGSSAPEVLDYAVLSDWSRARTGLDGGRFETTGYGKARRLVERLPDGNLNDYGPMDISIADPRGSGIFVAPDHDTAILGYVDRETRRYGLLKIQRGGKASPVAANGSLTNCSLNIEVTLGVCVLQSLTLPPSLVRIDLAAGALTKLEDIAPSYNDIPPLKIVSRTWTNRHGTQANGFIVYPRGYQLGKSYPTIVINHSGDADDTFLNQGFQWEYPIQVLAERGYLVVAINDPSPSQSPELEQAYNQWIGSGPLSREELQDRIWINIAHTFEDAVKELAKDGIADLSKVGIAGYSSGSQMVNVAMTQSKLFRAASSGDGGFLEPSGYFTNQRSYRNIYGGSPYDPLAVPYYQRLSPTFRASHASGPILQQVAESRMPTLQLHVALQDAGVPSEYVVYDGESHLFHKPTNRMRAMKENIAWFDFWLRDILDPEFVNADQMERWEALKKDWNAPRPSGSQ